MGQIVISFVLLVIFLTIKVEPAVTASQENMSSYPESAAIFNRARPVREGELFMLHDQMKQGDTLLTDRLKESYSNLKELLKDGDARLKEQLVEGVAQVKEQLKEGDIKLKEELDEDAAWLKDKLIKGENRMKEELAEGEAHTKEELTDQKDAFEKLRISVKEWTRTNSAAMDDMKQQMSDVQAELQHSATILKSTRDQLLTTQTELRATKEILQSTQDAQNKTKSTEEELLRSCEQLQNEITTMKTKLQTAEDEAHSLKVKVDTLQSTYRRMLGSSDMGGGQDFAEVGSTFTRWGRTSCPDNTSLVYSGVVGGSWYDHTGGASNYLCLVMDPQLDNMTLPGDYTYLYGGEYQSVEGHDQQDPVCSVCRAPQTTTLMIPATLTCPPGWTTQYKGHLMSGHHSHKRGTEYVCVDLVREDRDGGHENKNGALVYHVVSECGSLPCPPFAQHKVVTCVVCSM